MRGFFLTVATLLLANGSILAAEVEVKGKTTPTPAKTSPAPSATPAASPAATAPELPQFRPALLGAGPASVINRMDTAGLIRDGQKDGAVSFSCSVRRTGEIANVWTYRGTPGSTLLERELVRCLDTAVFVPAIHNRQTVHALFFGTVIFKVVDGKPRLRIFANQEPEELKKESDFVGPQPFMGPGSKFEGLHYPNDSLTSELSGIVELALVIDASGNMKELKIISETPPLAGFRRAAAEDFRVASFIPAFRDGKPVECSVTLPVYYEPLPPPPPTAE
jgi:Gram-negative bacterial TonB protein C-terminal